MKQEYDFSKAVKGKFYRGDRPFSVTIEGLETRRHPRYEVFRIENGMFRFRLRDDDRVLIESSSTFATEKECEEAISTVRNEAVIAPTIFA